MKKILLMGVSALCLLASCGVDKEGTADKLVSDLEKRDGVSYTDEQKDCIHGVIKSMSDDEITAIDEGKASAEDLATFSNNVLGCTSGETVDPATDETVAPDGADETMDTTES